MKNGQSRYSNVKDWLRLARVKAFPENILFFGNAIFRKGKCIQVFGCLEIHFTENQFRCLVRTNILWKTIFRKCYFPKRKMYSGVWLRTEFVLRKWDSSVCFRNSFYGNEIYGKSFPAFVSGKWNSFLYRKSFLMFGLCSIT